MPDIDTSVNTSEVAEQTENTTTTQQQENNTNTVSTEQNNQTVQNTSENNSGAANQNNVQDSETNRIYADARRRAQTEAQKQIDTEYDRLYGQQYNIHSKADYDKYMQNYQAQQEAQQKGIDPQFYQEFKTMENTLNSMQRQSNLIAQDRTLETDPKVGQIYTQWKDQVHQIADQYNVDYDTAFTFLTREKIADILAKTQTTTEQTTIKNLKNNATSTPGALGSEGAEHKTGYSAMTKEEKKALRERVLRGEHVDEI